MPTHKQAKLFTTLVGKQQPSNRPVGFLHACRHTYIYRHTWRPSTEQWLKIVVIDQSAKSSLIWKLQLSGNCTLNFMAVEQRGFSLLQTLLCFPRAQLQETLCVKMKQGSCIISGGCSVKLGVVILNAHWYWPIFLLPPFRINIDRKTNGFCRDIWKARAACSCSPQQLGEARPPERNPDQFRSLGLQGVA